MDWAQIIVSWITGIGAILAAASGVMLVIRNIRTRQTREIDRLDRELSLAWEELLSYHRYSYDLRATLMRNGIEVPELPEYSTRDARRGKDPKLLDET